MVLDSADAIDDDQSYPNLEFFLPDAPTVDVIITTRHVGAGGDDERWQRLRWARWRLQRQRSCSRNTRSCKSPRPDMNTKVLQIVAELGKLALAITLAGSYVAAIPRLRSDVRLFPPEYRERRKQLLSMKARKLIHQYGESMLSTWEVSFAVVEQQSAIAARLLGLIAFLNFDDIFPALFEQLRGGEGLVWVSGKVSSGRILLLLNLPRTYPTDPHSCGYDSAKTPAAFDSAALASYCGPPFPLHSIAGAGDGGRRRDSDRSWAAAAWTGVGGLPGVPL